MGFTKATKQNATIKLAITGPSGSGKTYSALLIAKGLGGKTALLDTEYGSASLYADRFDFDTWDEADPNGFPPEYFIGVIKAAESAGYTNLIIDSLSHEWNGRGGCLELADMLGRTKYRGNSYVAWGEVTPRHNRLVEAIVSAKLNIIVTMRAKSEYVLNKDEKSGKSTPQKVGLGSVQRDGMDYEFTVMFELDRDSHMAIAGKDRTSLFRDPVLISEETGKRVAAWLTTPQTATPAEPLQAIQPAKKAKLDAREYIVKDIDERIQNGETSESITKDYADILKTDEQRPIEHMSEVELKLIATELYCRKNPKARKPKKADEG